MPGTQDLSASTFLTRMRLVGLPVVAVFEASWSTPCRDLRPVLEQLARNFANKVEFRAVDAVEYGRLAGELKVWSLPTLLFFRGGREARRVEGKLPFETLEAMVADFVSPPRE